MSSINIKWAKIPKDIRELLLRNVWCVNCSDVVQVKDYHVDDDNVSLVIRGKCSVCGNAVCRVIDE